MTNKYFLIVYYLALILCNNSLADNVLDNLIPSESNQIINPQSIDQLNKNNNLEPKATVKPIEEPEPILEESKTQETIEPIKGKTLENNTSVTLPIQTSINDPQKSQLQSIEDQTDKNIQSKDKINSELINETNHKYKLSQINYSAMFSHDEIDAINKVINDTLIEKNQLSDNNNIIKSASNILDISSIAKELIIQKPKTIPSFYLNSIIYKDKDDWTIWINGRQFKEIVDKNIKIDNDNIINLIIIDEKYIIIKWKTKFLENYCPNWKGKFSYYEDIGFCSKDGNIIVDEDLETVTLKLRVNQSFVAKNMAISEGFKPFSPLIENLAP